VKGFTGCSGGGISLSYGPAAAQVLSNTISNNSCTSGNGGGIYAVGSVLIQDNLISRNLATGTFSQTPNAAGGGIYAEFLSNGVIAQNLIVGNNADLGAGILSTGDPSTVVFVNNAIAGNSSTQNQGSAIYIGVVQGMTQLFNNILVGAGSQNALFCDGEAPVFQNNEVFSNGGLSVLVAGTCVIPTGQLGNLSADPLFSDTAMNNYQLLDGSVAIDAGLNTALDLPLTDYYGKPRIAIGYIGDSPTVDMGIAEVQTAVVRPSPTPTATPTPVAFKLKAKPGSIDFGAVVLGTIGLTSPLRTITVTNAKGAAREAIILGNVSVSGDASGAYQLTGGNCVAGIPLQPDSSCTLDVAFTPLAAGASSGLVTIESDSLHKPKLEVKLSGTGALPVLAYSPAKLKFGQVSVGSSSTQLLTLTNNFAVPIALGSTSIGGRDPGDFQESFSCGTALAAQQSCTGFVFFVPTVEGSRKAALTIAATALPAMTDISLSGTGE
jgi:predicted outer membrane repeat protein